MQRGENDVPFPFAMRKQAHAGGRRLAALSRHALVSWKKPYSASVPCSFAASKSGIAAMFVSPAAFDFSNAAL